MEDSNRTLKITDDNKTGGEGFINEDAFNIIQEEESPEVSPNVITSSRGYNSVVDLSEEQTFKI